MTPKGSPALALGLVIVSLTAMLVFAANVIQHQRPLGRHIVLTSSDESEVAPYVRQFRDAGFSVTTDTQRVLERLAADDSHVTVFVVTRASLPELPPKLMNDLYNRGVVVVGLDVVMREFSRIVLGFEGGVHMVAYVPGKPAFSMLRANCSGSGFTSDFLRSGIALAELAVMRSGERCE